MLILEGLDFFRDRSLFELGGVDPKIGRSMGIQEQSGSFGKAS